MKLRMKWTTDERVWAAIASVAAIGAGLAASSVARAGFARFTPYEVPEDPIAQRPVDWRAAIVWSAALGAAVGVAGLLARAGTSELRRCRTPTRAVR